MKKNKIIIGIAVLVFVFITGWFLWSFMIPSQDLKKNIKDLQADAVGLERIITHTLYDGTKKTWECKTKIYPFPAQGGGAAFSFIDKNGKKIICGPGWLIEEK